MLLWYLLREILYVRVGVVHQLIGRGRVHVSIWRLARARLYLLSATRCARLAFSVLHYGSTFYGHKARLVLYVEEGFLPRFLGAAVAIFSFCFLLGVAGFGIVAGFGAS